MRSGTSSATTRASSKPRTEAVPIADASRWLVAGATLALMGGSVGAALDAVHVHTGTTGYTHPVLFGQAWWVPPLFAGAGVAIGLGRPIAERVVGRAGQRPSRSAAFAGMALFILAYVSSGLLHAWPVACSVVLAVLFDVGWLRCDRSTLGLVLAALTAVAGSAVEMLLVGVGAFFYVQPSLGSVAGWLPLLYCCASVGVGAFGSWLVDC